MVRLFFYILHEDHEELLIFIHRAGHEHAVHSLSSGNSCCPIFLLLLGSKQFRRSFIRIYYFEVCWHWRRAYLVKTKNRGSALDKLLLQTKHTVDA